MKILLPFTLFFSLFSLSLQAQPSAYPEKWILDDVKSDEFSGSEIDTSKWWILNPCAYTDSVRHGNIGGNGAIWREENVVLQNGNVVFKVEPNPDSADLNVPCRRYNVYPYYSGGLLTPLTPPGPDHGQRGNYSYGYYEIRTKLPGYYNSNHEPVGLGLFPTFWIAYQYAVDHCIYVHDEVDILEPSPDQYYDAKTNVCGWHDEANNCYAAKIGEDSSRSSAPLFEDYHKFGLDLARDHITFYFDDQPFFSKDTVTYPSIAHSLQMEPYLAVEINLQMGGGPGRYNLAIDAPYPLYMYVDYFRYYHPAEASTNFIRQNTPNPSSGLTEIECSIRPEKTNCSVNIYSLQGQLLLKIPVTEKGISKVTADLSLLPSGMYLYSLNGGDEVLDCKKLIIVNGF